MLQVLNLKKMCLWMKPTKKKIYTGNQWNWLPIVCIPERVCHTSASPSGQCVQTFYTGNFPNQGIRKCNCWYRIQKALMHFIREICIDNTLKNLFNHRIRKCNCWYYIQKALVYFIRKMCIHTIKWKPLFNQGIRKCNCW